MKTKLRILVAPLVVVCALALPLVAASDKENKKQENKKQEHKNQENKKQPNKWNQVEFKWHKVERDGRLQELPSKRKAEAIHRKADGTIGSRELRAALRLRGATFHVATLPAEVRHEPTIVEFMISGTAGASADQGSIINIDGAIIGFQQRPGGERADIMVLDAGPDGSLIWRKAGMGLPIDSLEGITASPRVAVRLNHADDEWSLYSKDVLVVGGLPLLAEKGAPTITVKAGPLDSNTLIIKKIQLRSNPSTRGKMFKSAGPREKSDHDKTEPKIIAAGE